MTLFKKLALPTVFITAAMMSGMTFADSHSASSSDQRSEMADIQLLLGAKVKINDAMVKAMTAHPNSHVIEVEIEHEHGMLFYKVKLILASGELLEIFIDSGDGAVLTRAQIATLKSSSSDDSDDSYDDSDDDSDDDRSGKNDDDDSDDDRSGKNDDDDDDDRSGKSDDSDDDDKDDDDKDDDDKDDDDEADDDEADDDSSDDKSGS